ncbi:MAG TPA: flagellar biosynthetic protein FliR [Desulfuromonadales bacterium]|nr:flagellar biosynthetic protein FliR [Desulfuromonadales bacterium]
MYPLFPFPSPREVIFFVLVLSRVAGIFAAMPVFGGRRLPLTIKAATVFMLALVCFPTLAVAMPEVPGDLFSLALLVLGEVMVGLTLAFITQIIFAAVDFSGQIIGMQMGLTISSIIDPSQGTSNQIMSVIQTLFATLTFLALNVHHLFIRAIIDSFRVIPLGGWHLRGELITVLVMGMADVFIIGIRLAAPVMVALLLTTVALGIMARAFPQMNIFMLSLPLNIGLGLIILAMTLTIFFHVLEVSFGRLGGQIETLFRLMAKGG